METKLMPTLAVAAFIAGCGGGSSSSTTAPVGGLLGKAAAAQDAAAESNARNAVTALETCFADAQTYAGCDVAQTLGTGVPSGSGPGQVEVQGADQTYTIIAHSESGDSFTITKDAQGALTRTCTSSDSSGGCQGGSW
jgi:type IV pilus assembly protein PilA